MIRLKVMSSVEITFKLVFFQLVTPHVCRDVCLMGAAVLNSNVLTTMYRVCITVSCVDVFDICEWHRLVMCWI